MKSIIQLQNTAQETVIVEGVSRRESIDTEQKCQEKIKLKPNSNSAFVTSLMVFPPQFIFTLLQTSVQTLAIDITRDLKIEVNQVQWLSHVENMVLCSLASVSNRLHAKFGTQRCYILGSYVSAIANLILFFYPQLWTIILMRAISALGLGVVIPATVPMTNYLVIPSQIERGLSYTAAFVPAAQIVATFLGSYLATTIGWKWMFFIGSSIGIIHAICISIWLPTPKGDKTVKLDFIGVALMTIFPALSILGIGFLLLKEIPVSVCFILMVVSVISLVIFFIYNKRWSVHKVIPLPVLNANTIIFLLQNFIMGAGVQADIFFQPILWQKVFQFDTIGNGILIGICKVIQLPFALLYPLIIKKVTIKYITTFCSSAFIVIYITQILVLQFFRNMYFIEVLNLLSAVIYMQNIIAIQVYNVVGSPKMFGPISSTYVGFGNKYAWSIGVAFSTLVQQISSAINVNQNYVLSVQLAYCAGVVFLIIAVVLSSKIGVFKWERGRLGFRENRTVNFKTYIELQSVNDELVDTTQKVAKIRINSWTLGLQQ
uniref:Major facilitator superfamily protein n=1 Tax=Trepomonas sp. PC1 TaxID=1076344 RepID=A0A146KMH6_9EUKA|eukprot:JAP96526.1 Major facilitator superfamily protein [Trepomonas sp. PC1]